MASFEVTRTVVVHATIKVVVDADNKDAAIAKVDDIMPGRAFDGLPEGWKASLNLSVKEGGKIVRVKVDGIEESSMMGGAKVRRLKE